NTRAAATTTALRVLATEIGWFSGGPGLPPKLAPSVDGQRFAGHESAGRTCEIGTGFGDIPRRTRPHHRIRSGVRRSRLGRIAVPAFGLDRTGGYTIHPDIEWGPFDGNAARKADNAGSRGDRVRDAVEALRCDDHNVDDAAG